MKQVCQKCQRKKILSEFPRRRDAKLGVSYTCKSCKSDHDRNYYLLNRESRLDRQKETRKLKGKEIYEQRKASGYIEKYRLENKEKIRKQNLIKKQRYYQTERGKLVILTHNATRRALQITTSDGSIIPESLVGLLESQNYCCNICQIRLTLPNRHLDHVIPLSRQGKHTLVNVQWLCSSCNLRKYNKILNV